MSRRVRVFVSSTFADMVQERGELMRQTWPRLRRFCSKRWIELVDVDLQWGISEEQSRRKETLRLCLDEVQACRPFFIGILGERYGTRASEEAFTPQVLRAQPWLRRLRDRSLTELEIRHGVLNDPQGGPGAFFYFRNPAYARARGGVFLVQSAAAARRQAALKRSIRAVCARSRACLREPYDDPRRLARMVLKDLTAAIAARFPAEEDPDALERQRLDHESFAASRRRTYVACPDQLDALDRHARAGGGPLVVSGVAGVGKSALLANWLARWRRRYPADLVFQHYVGATPDSARHWRLIERLIGEIAAWTDAAGALPRSRHDVLRSFPFWLARARAQAQRQGVRCIVVIDGLDRLEDRYQAHRLGWLPTDAFSGPLRLLVSIRSGQLPRSAKAMRWQRLRVARLDPERRREMITAYLARFGQTLDSSRLERLAGTRPAGNPLYLKIVLDELRVTGAHDLLDQQLDAYLSARSIPTLLRRVLRRFERDYERERPGLVSDALASIHVARRGLSEPEILRLLAPGDLMRLPAAIWAPLRAALEEMLVNRGGILDFAHDLLRDAVAKAFVREESVRARRARLAEEFERQAVSPRSSDELPWLLQRIDARERLRASLVDIDRFLEIEKRDAEELGRYWVWLGEQRVMGPAYRDALRKWSRSPRARATLARAASHVGYFLGGAALYEDAEPIMREALATAERWYGREHRHVAPHLTNLGILLGCVGRLGEAMQLLRRAVAIAERAYGPRHSNVAGALDNLAQALADAGDPAAAEPMLRRALEIDRAQLGGEHPIVATRLNNLAQVLKASGRWAEAEPMLREALQIDRDAVGANRPTVAIHLANLANLLLSDRRLEEAEPKLREALLIAERSHGAEHPVVAFVLRSLAELMQATERLDDAEELLDRALEIDRHTLDPDHPDVAADLAALGRLYLAGQRPSDAERATRRALEIGTRRFGPRHPQVAAMLEQLASVLGETERWEDAERSAREALQIAEEAFGRTHSITGAYVLDAARILVGKGDAREAESLLRRALAIADAGPSGDPSLLVSSLRGLAGVLCDTDRSPEAVPLLRRALRLSERVYGRTHVEVAACARELGDALRVRGNFAAASSLAQRARGIDTRRFPPDHPVVIGDLKLLARSLIAHGESLMREAMRFDIDRFGEDSAAVADDRAWIRDERSRGAHCPPERAAAPSRRGATRPR